ncbi:serine/threonine protein kinase [Pseudoxanthomonas daejeonensis]|uniref:serine/threonine-protein kinase n=1 Tax=Pseudoxanthomonas daejeonensis TaxID=266062 RepID=UPI001F5414D2|nr:serine/threonine-protein kinase [Pseudoxanthomonas daejeonensis]UNK56273.1 serine/threonine protein kinase [Pseudoxanthomonas daejeonensis]
MSGADFQTPFHKYTPIRQLGQGGSGRVFEVRGDDGRLHALKVLDAGGVTAERKARFRNEIAFCQQNIHPGIVRVTDVGYVEEEGKVIPFYVMPLYPRTLRSLIGEGIDPRRALNLFMQLVSAMSVAHAKDVLHRDIKPENILIDEMGNAVLADFGIARFSEIDAATLVATREGSRLANYMYAAPEQRVVGSEIDQKADVYAIGLIGHEMLTGQVPLGEGARMVLDAAPKFSFMDSVLQRMRRQDPEDRPTLGEVEEQVRAQLSTDDQDEPITAEGSKDSLGRLGSLAARVAARHEHQRLRRQFNSSDAGVFSARKSFDLVRERIQERVDAFGGVASFGIRADVVSGGHLEVKAADFSGVPAFRAQYANSLDGAKATFTVWEGAADLPGRMFFDRPKRVKEEVFLPDIDESGAVVWKSGEEILSENDLADHMLALLLEVVEKRLGG